MPGPSRQTVLQERLIFDLWNSKYFSGHIQSIWLSISGPLNSLKFGQALNILEQHTIMIEALKVNLHHFQFLATFSSYYCQIWLGTVRDS